MTRSVKRVIPVTGGGNGPSANSVGRSAAVLREFSIKAFARSAEGTVNRFAAYMRLLRMARPRVVIKAGAAIMRKNTIEITEPKLRYSCS